MKLCCIFNIPSLYREKIYKEIDKEYDCAFHVQGLRNANYRERTTQKAHADTVSYTHRDVYKRQVQAMVATIAKEVGTSDILVNNAGIIRRVRCV